MNKKTKKIDNLIKMKNLSKKIELKAGTKVFILFDPRDGLEICRGEYEKIIQFIQSL